MATEPHTVLTVGEYIVAVATGAGPRILSFRRPHGPDLFAELGDLSITDGGHTYRFIGGHRLWQAPEEPQVTYRPDDVAVEILEGPNGVTVRSAPDPDGLVKSVRIVAAGNLLAVEHTITNRGPEPVTLAPWAITQMRPGGVALVPLATDPGGDKSLLPNHALVLWPYTDLSMPDFSFSDDLVRIQGSDRQGKAKVGVENKRGWLAYHLDDELFIKWAPIRNPTESHVDMNATMQCFRNEFFVELESLGPLVAIAPGDSTTHTEHWGSTPAAATHLDEVVASLDIAPGLVRS